MKRYLHMRTRIVQKYKKITKSKTKRYGSVVNKKCKAIFRKEKRAFRKEKRASRKKEIAKLNREWQKVKK